MLGDQCDDVIAGPRRRNSTKKQEHAGQSLPTSCRTQCLDIESKRICKSKKPGHTKCVICLLRGRALCNVPDILESRRRYVKGGAGRQVPARCWDPCCLLMPFPLGINSLCSRQHQHKWHLLMQKIPWTSSSALAKPQSPGPGLQRIQPYTGKHSQHLHTQTSCQLSLFA